MKPLRMLTGEGLTINKHQEAIYQKRKYEPSFESHRSKCSELQVVTGRQAAFEMGKLCINRVLSAICLTMVSDFLSYFNKTDTF